jgi:hypothetical protein
MQPSHLVSIETRRHILPNPTRTRLGVGASFIDHAAGVPLRSRHSSPPPVEQVEQVEQGGGQLSVPPQASAIPRYAQSWDDEASLHDSGMLHARIRGNDAPVNLPLKPRWTTYAIVATIVVAFIAVGLSIGFAGRTHTIDGIAPGTPAAEPAVAQPPPQ